MNLYQCQNWAQENGFDKAEFLAMFPVGLKKCKWLDAYFGLFKIEGIGDGFVTVKDIDNMFPNLVCEPLTAQGENND